MSNLKRWFSIAILSVLAVLLLVGVLAVPRAEGISATLFYLVAYGFTVIAAFADPANAGKGVLKVEGRMTELLHLEMAKRTVAVADGIARLGSGR